MKKSKANQEWLKYWRKCQKKRKTPKDKSHQKTTKIGGHVFVYLKCVTPKTAGYLPYYKASNMHIIYEKQIYNPTTDYYNYPVFTQYYNFVPNEYVVKNLSNENQYIYKCNKCNLMGYRHGKTGELKHATTCEEMAFKELLL